MWEHLGLEQRLPGDERLAGQVAPLEHQQIEHEVADRRVRRGVVLQQRERRAAILVERDDLAVYHGLVRQVLQPTRHRGVAHAEVVVVA
jgi:hypothetical protein